MSVNSLLVRSRTSESFWDENLEQQNIRKWFYSITSNDDSALLSHWTIAMYKKRMVGLRGAWDWSKGMGDPQTSASAGARKVLSGQERRGMEHPSLERIRRRGTNALCVNKAGFSSICLFVTWDVFFALVEPRVYPACHFLRLCSSH